MDEIVIAVDAMGGDIAPDEILGGCAQALCENPDINILLVGKADVIEPKLNGLNCDASRLRLVNAQEVIDNNEAPAQAIKSKKDSSIVVGLSLLAKGSAGAFVSAGCTGALLTGAAVIVGRVSGIERPALATLLPGKNGYSMLVDSGANIDCKPNYLKQFALMGSVYMENVMGVNKPRVGLLNIGAEEEKGNLLTKEAYKLLAGSGLNFVGNIEARDVPLGAADVVVCDGFAGNIVLKHTEGLSKAIFDIIKGELMQAPSQSAAESAAMALRRLKSRFDPSEVGGAAFLGLNSLVVKAHGSSDAKAVKNAVVQSKRFIENNLTQKIAASISV